MVVKAMNRLFTTLTTLTKRKLTSFTLLLVLLSIAALPAAVGATGEEVTLTLAEVIDTALKNSLDLSNAELDVAKAEQDRLIAGRQRLPEVTFNTTYTRMDQGSSGLSAIPGFTLPGTEADLSVSAQVPLYTGGRISSGYRQASLGYDLSIESRRAALGDLFRDVTISFYGILSAGEQINITEEALRVSRQHLRDVNLLLKQGIVARIDQVRSELDVAEREKDVAGAVTRLTVTSEQLSAVLFPDRFLSLAVKGEFYEPAATPSLADWFDIAMKHSPEIRSAHLGLRLAEAGVDLARADDNATLALFGQYGAKDEDFTTAEDARYWNAGVSFSRPLYLGGRNRAAVKKEADSVQQAKNNVVMAERNIRAGIVEIIENIRLSASEFSAAMKAIEAGEENLRITRLKYKQGLIANTDVIDAQLALTRSRLLRITALQGYHTNRTRLLRTAGVSEEIQ